MILGVGADHVTIARVARAMENPRFLERIYTAAEREAMQVRGREAASFAAARWAGKEAVAKALGTGFPGCPPACVEILSGEDGKPTVTLSGTALSTFQKLGGEKIWISLSHEGGIAMAFAMAEGGGA